MDIFSKNKALMKDMEENFYRQSLLDPSQFGNIMAEWNQKGLFLKSGEGTRCYAGSTYRQESEMKWLLVDIDPSVEYILFMGTANEAAVKLLKRYLKNLYAICFIEPANQIFQATLQQESIWDIAKAGGKVKIHFFCNMHPEEIVKPICSLAGYGNRIEVVCSPNYRSLFSEYYDALLQQMVKAMRLQTVNVLTNIISRKKFLRHTLANYCLPAADGIQLKSLLQGKPAVLVGAGPSLKKNLHLLQAVKDDVVIFACGSSIPTLRQFGIQPHFNVIYEAGDNSIFTAGESFRDIPIIFGSQANPKSLLAYQGPKLHILTDTDELTAYYFDQSNEVSAIHSGPSVMNIAHDFVCQMECSPIIFIGQDMCLYDNALHAIDDKHIVNPELIPAGKIEYKGDFVTEDIYGAPVETLRPYWTIKNYLEKIVALYPQQKFINATEGGLGIAGVPNDTLEHVLAAVPKQETSLAAVIAEWVRAQSSEHKPMRIELLIARGFGRDIKSIFAKGKNIWRYIEELERGRSVGKRKEALRRIETQYAKLQEDVFFRRVVRPILGEMLKNIEARYLVRYETSRDEDRAAIGAEKYKAAVGEVLRFCHDVSQYYEDALDKNEIMLN